MIILLRLLLIAALLLPFGAPAARAQVSPAARMAWGFDRSDLPPHPGVRFGVLANGMRYALMRSAAPAGALSVRFHVAAGAMAEGPRERGFAHLVEHLLFQGTRNIPEGSLPLMLAHRGMRHWSDINALTGYEDTLYRLDMTRADAAAREAALLVMRDVAGGLLFTKAAVAGAKRDVVAEIAARDAVADAIVTAENAFFAPGTPIARGTVAGTAREVRRATAEGLRRFYERWYRPEHTTLILVGDFDPEAAEREIGARFSDWKGPAKTDVPRATVPALRARRGAEARLFVHRGAPTAVAIALATPLGGSADIGRRRDAHFLERLGSDMLMRRLRGAAPGADVAVYDHFGTVRLARIAIPAPDRNWRRALAVGAGELARAVDGGFTEAELAATLGPIRAALVRDAKPRTTKALADALADAVSRGIVFTAPADPAGTDAYLARARIADVNAAFRAAWARPDKFYFVTHNRQIPGGGQAIRAAAQPLPNGPIISR